MNEATAKKLRKNPHYKMSAKQESEARDVERKPMVEFGEPEIHENEIPRHKTKVRAKKVSRKKI